MKKNILTIVVLLISIPLAALAQAIEGFEGVAEYNLPKPLQRILYFQKQRAYPNAEIPEGAREKAFGQMENMVYQNHKSKNYVMAQQPEWRPLGPYNVGGRVKSIVVHPTDPNKVYIAAAAGGIWRSLDGGDSWEPIFDHENAISFGALAIDNNNPDVIYAGTGEAVIGFSIYMGRGMYKSTDGGDSWNLIGLAEVGKFSKAYVHPKNSNLVFAGAISRGAGFYRSSDAGATWKRTFEGPVSDVSIDPNDENIVMIGVTGQGVFKSTDAGLSWTDRSGFGYESVGRISVQMAPREPNIAYALMERPINDVNVAHIYKTTDGGLSWSKVLNTTNNNFFNNQGFYDNFIAVNPVNSDIVIAGGIRIWQTTNGGGNWSNVGGGVHSDQHCAYFSPSNPQIVYLGNDGGVYKSTAGGSNWRDVNNGLQITQFYAIAIDNTQTNTNYGGTQDNGTLGIMNGLSYWNRIFGADGGKIVVDPEQPYIVYGQIQYGQMFRINFKTGKTTSIVKGIPYGSGNAPFISEIATDPVYGGVIYAGRNSIYASYNGGNDWEEMSPDFGSMVSSIDVSKVTSNKIYGGSAAGVIMVTDDGGLEWHTPESKGLARKYITSIFTSYNDENTAFATVSGFGNPHVFKTTDLGESWEHIGKSLPDIPVNGIAVHPENEDIIFVATDIGVFATFNGGSTWFPYGRGLPRSPVIDIAIHQDPMLTEGRVLRVATHGRSMWEVAIPDEVIEEAEISTPAGGEFFVSQTNQTIAWYGFDLPVVVEFSPDDGATWQAIAENVAANSMSWKVKSKPTFLGRIRITSMTNSEQVVVSNTFTISQMQRGSFLQATTVSYVPYGIASDGKGSLYTTSFYTDKMYKLDQNTFIVEKEMTLRGDSLFTDLTIDKVNNVIYLHRLLSTDQSASGIIASYDMDGKLLKEFPSPNTEYPVGIEMLDGKLLIGERQGGKTTQKLQIIDPITGVVEFSVLNPYNKRFGPRGLGYDGEKYVYQICTNFPSSGPLTEVLLMRIDKNDLGTEVDKIPLEDINGLINARGVDFDPVDKNFWVSTFDGSIYKLAGFETVVNSVDDDPAFYESIIETDLYPNPMTDFSTFTFKLKKHSGRVRVELSNVLGERIGRLFDKNISALEPNVVQINGNGLESGMYYVSIFIDGKLVTSEKLVVVK